MAGQEVGFEFIGFYSCKREMSCNEWRSNLLEGRRRFVHVAAIMDKVTLTASSATQP
jgi:hypothetical protein